LPTEASIQVINNNEAPQSSGINTPIKHFNTGKRPPSKGVERQWQQLLAEGTKDSHKEQLLPRA
jgi:hypothetical protein